jgi:hypothetical protein
MGTPTWKTMTDRVCSAVGGALASGPKASVSYHMISYDIRLYQYNMAPEKLINASLYNPTVARSPKTDDHNTENRDTLLDNGT